jgi:hypothetical protein
VSREPAGDKPAGVRTRLYRLADHQGPIRTGARQVNQESKKHLGIMWLNAGIDVSGVFLTPDPRTTLAAQL